MYTLKIQGFLKIVYVMLLLEYNFIEVHTPSRLEEKNDFMVSENKISYAKIFHYCHFLGCVSEDRFVSDGLEGTVGVRCH